MVQALRIGVAVMSILLGVQLQGAPAWGSGVPEPSEVFGFSPGSDRQLIDYSQLVGYLEQVDRASDRVELRKVGASPLGRPMYVAFISAPANIAALDHLQEINRRLALEPDLGDELDDLVSEGRVFVMATLSMHSTEVGPSQALPLLAWQLATTTDPEMLEWLDDVVLMVVPCHNPDGMDMVVEHYRETLGTPYEGSSLPGVYHRYVGHDNNRDFISLTQEDTRVINRLFSTEWYPQVLVEKHQMGGSGPRYYVPPSHDPIAENIDERLWRWTAVFGTDMARRMTADGLKGVAQHWLFDDYWPGSTETSLWKNVISLLTEGASCHVATPVRVEPGELQVHGKGLSEYVKSTNMPDPWPGGWWRLGDIVSYELSSYRALLQTASLHRGEILKLRNELCRLEVERGRTEAPFAWVLPAEQHDRGELVDLVALLTEHGVEVDRLTSDVVVGDRMLHAGDLVVPMVQPYRAFVKEVMEAQRYPVRHYTPGGEVIRPYDITSWSLPLHAGLESFPVGTRSAKLEKALAQVHAADLRPSVEVPARTWALAFDVRDNASFRAAFTALDTGLEVRRLDQDLSLDGADPGADGPVRLGAGSFVIRGGRAELQELADGLPMAPVVLARAVKAPMHAVEMPRIVLVETWVHDMDAGWTRYLLDTYRVPYTVVRPGELQDLDLAGTADIVVFPDADAEVLKTGRLKRGDRYQAFDLPPRYTLGIGTEGMGNLLGFLAQGGRIVAWRRSVPLFLGLLEMPKSEQDGTEEAGTEKAGTEKARAEKAGTGDMDDLSVPAFELPVKDVSKAATKAGLVVPGALLRVEVLEGHPLTLGMPETTDVFSRGTPVLETSIPSLDMDRRVLAWFPERDLLVSGYAEHAEELARHPAMIWVRKGKGQLVLYAFNPQHRASTPATYKLLLNALLPLPEAEAATRPGG